MMNPFNGAEGKSEQKIDQMKITIPAPCDQKWEEMTPKGMNRHCQLCQKEIVDFTHFSDAALARYIEANSGRVCGRFVSDQLNRELVYQAPKKSFLSYISQKWLAFWLLFSSPSLSVKAQVKVEQSELEINHNDTSTFTIKGKVLNNSMEPIRGLEVTLFELGQKTITDENGYFSLTFDDGSFERYTLILEKSESYLNIHEIVKDIPMNKQFILTLKTIEKVEFFEGEIVIPREPKVEKKKTRKKN